jgi:hypothetical protein
VRHADGQFAYHNTWGGGSACTVALPGAPLGAWQGQVPPRSRELAEGRKNALY